MIDILASDDITLINATAYRLLERMGTKIESENVRLKLVEMGARESSDSDVLLIPEEMVREALEKCPGGFPVCSRQVDSEPRRAAPGEPPQYWTTNAMHLVSGSERRPLQTNDLSDFARLADNLENIGGVVGMNISDVPSPARDFVGFRLMAEQTAKHLRPCIFTPAGAEAIIEMAELLLDGESIAKRPIFSLGYTSVTPLHWSAQALELFERSSGRGVPMALNGEPTIGTTSPVTPAAAIALAVAEVLSGIVIVQALEPGRPCLFNIGFSHTADMRSGSASAGAPECALIASAGVQMARHYGLPSVSWVSSDSSIADGQSAAESSMGYLAHTLSGVNVIWGAGSLESELSVCMEKAVIDNESISAARRLARGVEVNPDTLAEEVIVEAGRGGDYLGHEHTFNNFRKALWHPALFKRGRRENWQAEGAKPVEERACEKVRGILDAPREPVLDDRQWEGLLKIEKKWLERVVS